MFPEDQQIELEYWAETGEFSSTEMYQMKVRPVPSRRGFKYKIISKYVIFDTDKDSK